MPSTCRWSSGMAMDDDAPRSRMLPSDTTVQGVALGAFAAAVLLAGLLVTSGVVFATTPQDGPAVLVSPTPVGGATGSDASALDVYPAAAFDFASQRYLVVWLSARNAGSSADGLDVYGAFLNSRGERLGSEFRVSDSNTAARSSLPSVAAGQGEFAVAWTTRGTSCSILGQKVSDSSYQADQVLATGVNHIHSPSLVLDSSRQRYLLAFVEGDDYLPPAYSGSQPLDCASTYSSTSQIEATYFRWVGGNLEIGVPMTVSSVAGGAFRPRLSYSAPLDQYLVAWEDRRSAGNAPFRFDVYGRLIQGNLSATGADIALATGGDYTNYDTSASWTPRPAVAGGRVNFLATWFARQPQGGAVTWSVQGRQVLSDATAAAPFTIASMTFAQQHPGQSPTGFLAAAYNSSAREYLVGLTSHLESVWGYFSLALVQRISPFGQLVKLDGTALIQPGIGYSVDYGNEDQLALALAVNPMSGPGSTEYLVAYGRHAPGQPSQDSDIWAARLRLPASDVRAVYLPLAVRNSGQSGLYNWLDAVVGGTIVAQGDDVYEYISLPFTFTFYGNSYSGLYVSSNGYASFGTGSAAYSNGCIPSPGTPNNAIYAFWDDLAPLGGSNGNVYAKQIDASTFVVEWHQVRQYGSSNLETFEIVLKRDNSVTLQYQTMSNAGSATVGVENSDGTAARQYLCNGVGAPLANQMAIQYTTP